MDLRNARGAPVDPVPFFVTTGLAFAICYSFGPPSFMTVGIGMRWAIGLSTVPFVVTTVVAFYRLVWSARPDLKGEVPADVRLRRLFLATIIGMVTVVGVTVLLLAR